MVETTTSPVPTRLRYRDSNGDLQTIGTMLFGTEGSITTATLKNSAPDYNKLVIEGNQELQENMPVSETEFGLARNNQNEPEIMVEIFRNGSWEPRSRVYAREGGKTDDNGNYKNTNLFGHQRYTGEQRVEITNPVTTNAADALSQILPPGYTLQVPNDVTPPNVDNYTFKGRRENAYIDLTQNQGEKDDEWFLIFTAKLDANDDYIVRYEPQGYGDVEGSIIRGQTPFVYDYWKKKDTKTVFSEVTAKAVDVNDNVLQVTRTASDLGETPALTRSKTVDIDYIVSGSSELQTIAENHIQSSFVEHGAIEGPLYIDNTVNFSVDILDSEKNIDDTYTVVEQKDYLHQGETWFSFEFEKRSNIEDRVRNKTSRGEFDSLFGTDQTNVGGQNLGENTSVTTSQTDVTATDSGNTFDTAPAIVSGQSTATTLPFETATASDSNFTIAAGATNTVSTSITYDGNLMIADCKLKMSDPSPGIEFSVSVQVSGFTVKSNLQRTDNGGEINLSVPIPGNQSGLTVEFVVNSKMASDFDVDQQVINLSGEDGHVHGSDTYESDDHNHAARIDNDPGHGSPNDDSTHDPQGSTDEKNINVGTEDKTNR